MDPVTLVKSPIANSQKAPKGSWYWTPVYGQADKPRSIDNASVRVACGGCGKPMGLRDAACIGLRADGTSGHDIAADGTVMPILRCPWEKCGWSAMVVLADWDGGNTRTPAVTEEDVPAAGDDVDHVETIGDQVEVIATIEAKRDLPPTAGLVPLAPSVWKCPVCQWEQPCHQIPVAHAHSFHGGNCPCCHKGVMVQVPAFAPAKSKE